MLLWFCFSFFLVRKIKMRSDRSNWETWGPLETPKQWWGQGGTCFFFLSFFFSYSTHFLNRPSHHPAAQCFPILKFSQHFRCSQFHNAQMLSFGPLPPQPRAIIHNLSVELGVKEVGEGRKRGSGEQHGSLFRRLPLLEHVQAVHSQRT